MEPTETNITVTPDEPNGLLLLEDAQAYLHESGKWAKFLGITGYILTGLILIAGVFFTFMTGNSMSASPFQSIMGPIMGVMYFIIGVFYFFFANYLYKFGKGAIDGVEYQDAVQISAGLGKLKSLFKFWGILTIVMLAIYGLAFIGIIAGAAFMR